MLLCVDAGAKHSVAAKRPWTTQELWHYIYTRLKEDQSVHLNHWRNAHPHILRRAYGVAFNGGRFGIEAAKQRKD